MRRVGQMKAFDRGMLDFKRGQVSNPFNLGTQRYKDWESGFNKAYFDNLSNERSHESAA